ncbi:putative phosphothreonine lyase domain-containg protein [Methanoculleus sp.]|uniref:putative phosphothreonine lyase domain-containing protein n=1 Tax=Methanoculleus sp. TaxID=90427 RepID=UPI0025F6E4E0|nr:putative phosphothreonine lyase domain-containg protein [Methanoculleus sp.]
MEEIDPGSLADVAYGIFEVYLNRELHARGPYLFELVEQGVDFEADVRDIFGRFGEDYPELAGALLSRFGGIDAVYAPLSAGEGVLPSKTTRMYWIVQDAPEPLERGLDDEQVGKWLIFVPADEVDEAWRKVRDGTIRGRLGISAKVSTAKPNPDSRDERSVIYVYTRDWADEADVMRVRERLRDLGFVDRIGYKRNIETYRGEYSEEGRKVTYYSA